MSTRRPWIGFDLDGTAARYTGWKHDGGIEEPIPRVARLIRAIHAAGVFEVRIFTARVSSMCPDVEAQRRIIEAWCATHLGFVPRVTAEKDFDMVLLLDDRAVGIVPNEGVLALGIPKSVIDATSHVMWHQLYPRGYGNNGSSPEVTNPGTMRIADSEEHVLRARIKGLEKALKDSQGEVEDALSTVDNIRVAVHDFNEGLDVPDPKIDALYLKVNALARGI